MQLINLIPIFDKNNFINYFNFYNFQKNMNSNFFPIFFVLFFTFILKAFLEIELFIN